ncbi:MAG: GntR family transcriptional regulator [Subtercola sp.]|nr:GntR family transcriptional regulator [Subtercola sp.]
MMSGMPHEREDEPLIAALPPSIQRGSSRRYLTVVARVLTAIGSGNLSTGDRLPNERALAEMCGTSRPTVRDALLVLELFGVVEVRPGSGCYVADWNTRQFHSLATLDATPRELLDARLSLEPTVAGMSAGRLDRTGHRRLTTLIDESVMDKTQVDNFEGYFRISQDFHATLAEYCGNPFLVTMTRQLVDVVSHPLWTILNGVSLQSAESRDAQAVEHRAILDAVVDGDAEAASAAMHDHLQRLAHDLFGLDATTPGIVRQRPRTR